MHSLETEIDAKACNVSYWFDLEIGNLHVPRFISYYYHYGLLTKLCLFKINIFGDFSYQKTPKTGERECSQMLTMADKGGRGNWGNADYG